jgi:hypothetical protein
MISGIIEWRFNCDEASETARKVFDKVMNYDWLREHGIQPFDSTAAWEEAMRQLSQVTKRSPVTRVRIREGKVNPCWDNLWTGLVTGGEQ